MPRDSLLLRPLHEDGKVVPFRHLDKDGFGGAFLGEVGLKLLSQETRMCAYDAVFAGVVAGWAAEDTYPDLLLGCLFG
ncbi:MAG: hypothetical protein WAL75_06340 [Terracidiphilus sp.]